MGEDLTQEGRNAIRTPMQWSGRANAGFSTAPKKRLVRPVISGGDFGFETINVDAQRHDRDSLLNWFERMIHTERKNGELTAERLCALWLEVQHESLGPAIELKPGYETFWAYIPHFVHSPFYVYAYAFGDCLVNSLYAVYERAAEGFAERYLEMLSAGGTKHHAELLAPFGLDARDPAFWQEGLGVIERMITELEGLD